MNSPAKMCTAVFIFSFSLLHLISSWNVCDGKIVLHTQRVCCLCIKSGAYSVASFSHHFSDWFFSKSCLFLFYHLFWNLHWKSVIICLRLLFFYLIKNRWIDKICLREFKMWNRKKRMCLTRDEKTWNLNKNRKRKYF